MTRTSRTTRSRPALRTEKTRTTKTRQTTNKKKKTRARDSSKTNPARSAAQQKLEREVSAALKRLIQRHLRDDKLLRDLDSAAILKLSEVEVDGYQYVLTRTLPIQDETLTERQRQIARWVAEGLSNKAIAEKLQISPATVAAHLRTIFAKLRVTSRTALAKHALSFLS